MISTILPTCATSVASKIATIGSRKMRLMLPLCLAAVMSAGCSKDEPTKDELLSRAEAAFAAGQWDKAEMDYRKVLSLAPEDQAALRQLGIIYLDQGQIMQAYPLLKKGADLQPDDGVLQPLDLEAGRRLPGVHDGVREINGPDAIAFAGC